MAPISNSLYGNESYKRMVMKNTPKAFEERPEDIQQRKAGERVGMVMDFIAGTAMVLHLVLL